MAEMRKNLINEVFNSALVAAGVVAVSMGAKKLLGDALGITQTLTGFGKLAIGIAVSTVGVRTLQAKGYLPTEVDK